MAGENSEVVRRMYDAFHSGEARAALECFAPDVLFDPAARPDVGKGRGREFVGRAIASWIGTFDDWREEIESIRELEDDQVLVVITQRGRGKGSGIEVEQRYAAIYEIEDGLIATLTLYMTEAEALRAAKGAASE